MSYTSDDLTAIDRSIASGSLSVRIGDRQETFRSLSELLQIRNLIRQELGLIEHGTLRFVPLYHDKGTR